MTGKTLASTSVVFDENPYQCGFDENPYQCGFDENPYQCGDIQQQ